MYDAIIVGARCAGAPTGLLLARKGYKVLLLDRSTFPSDMPFSNHYVHQTGSARLKRWGVLENLVATGCPPIRTNYWDYGPFILRGSPQPTEDGIAEAYAPRRLALDPILVKAAVMAGAEFRERFSVQGVLWEDDLMVGIRGREKNGATVTERARITVGADGMFSLVASAAKAPEYCSKPPLEGSWYCYWSSVTLTGWHLWIRPHRVIFGFPTNEGLSLIGVAFAACDLAAVRRDVERSYIESIAEHAPDLEAILQGGRRESRFVGGAIPAYVRKPFGPGWALVGDAGYQKDPCTASGITDAFASAEWLAEAIDAGLSGRQPLQEALAGYERKRNHSELPYYELTEQLATFEASTETQRLLSALVDNPEQRSRWFGVLAHTVAVQDFFAPQNVQRILGCQKQAA